MNTATTSENDISLKLSDLPSINEVAFNEPNIHFTLSDGRIIVIPTSWLNPVHNAEKKLKLDFKIENHFVIWDQLDFILGVKNLLNGSICPK
ncbi:MAG: DUF2442 domain-containing protein [Cyclobacteriaceae bacterium]